MQIVVKHGPTKHELTIEPTQSLADLQSQLYSLTNVPPARQKILAKGKVLTDQLISTLKEGATLMLMGSVDPLQNEDKKMKSTVFIEDMSQSQINTMQKVPQGLVNLGNTCYMSSTIQCLRAITELKPTLSLQKITASSTPLQNLASSLGALIHELESGGANVMPIIFLQLLRNVFPQFAERNHQGVYLQQDAEECWGQIISGISNMPEISVDGTVNQTPSSATKRGFIEQYMAMELTAESVCDDVPLEEKTISILSVNKLLVNIGAGTSTHLVTELLSGLTEKLVKHSPSLGRDANYTKTSKFSRLPQYFCVNFVRFQWKPQERVKAKILKRVQFPHELDMVPFCTPELQKLTALGKARAALNSNERDSKKKMKLKQDSSAPESVPISRSQIEVITEIGCDASFIRDPGLNPSGQYDLVAVLTHMGRAADSGHYMAWVKQTNSDAWWKFDDDVVSACTSEDIVKLEGGGDWHTAYICLYKAKILE